MKKILLSASILMASVGVANAASFAVVANGDNTFTLSSDTFTGQILGKYAGSNLAQGWDSLKYAISNNDEIVKDKGNDVTISHTEGWVFDLPTLGKSDGANFPQTPDSGGNVTGLEGYSYFSLHAGNNTVFFALSSFSAASDVFTFSTTGNGAGLSNFRVFDGTPQSEEIFAPVPEPEEWAMMLLGLPLMGFIARRKKNDNNFNFVNAVVA